MIEYVFALALFALHWGSSAGCEVVAKPVDLCVRGSKLDYQVRLVRRSPRGIFIIQCSLRNMRGSERGQQVGILEN